MACLKPGLIDDRYAGKSGKRQVSLLQYEHLVVIGALTGRNVCPDLLRRNLVVSRLNLLALKKVHPRIGDAVLEITGACHLCSKMEKALGPGGFNTMRGHGRVTTRIAQGGRIRLGDGVILIGAWE
jgi:MOSC domain-containing protein YiiM